MFNNKSTIAPPPEKQLTEHSYGFTLAEVLITLGIIGIVAAITLPTIITNYQDKITVTKVKKAYTIFSQAYLRAIDDNGGLPKEEWDCSKFESTSDGSKFSRCYMSYMLPYLQKVENCYVDSNTRKKCHFSSFIDNNITQGKNTPYYNLHGEIMGYLGDGGGAYTIASGGIEFMMYRDYIAIKTDTNSKNILNKNLFFFKLDNNKLRTTSGYTTNIEQYWTGFTCPGCISIATGWILLHSNLDYLRCPDKVKINGPYSCK